MTFWRVDPPNDSTLWYWACTFVYMGQNARNVESEYLGAVAEVLRMEAARQRISIRDLARRSGVPYGTVQRSLAGQRMIDVDELLLISSALGLRASEILNRVSSEAEEAAILRTG